MRGFCVLAEQGQLIFADAYFCQLFGLTGISDEEQRNASPWLDEFIEVIKAKAAQNSRFKWVLANQAFEININRVTIKSLLVVQVFNWSSPLSESYASEAEQDANIGSWSLNFSDESVIWSPQIYKIYGLNPDMPVSVALGLANYSEESQQKLSKYLADARFGIGFSEEFDFFDANNHYKRVHAIGRPVLDENNLATGVKGTLQDVSNSYFERRRNELAVEVAGMGVWELQASGHLIWNQQMLRIYEYDHMDNLSMEHWRQALHKEEKAPVERAFYQSIEEQSVYKSEYRIVGNKSGEIKYIRAIARHFYDKHGNLEKTVGVNHDITKEHQVQQERLIAKARDIQKSKFIALGEMAAGIGHEINNPLAILHGNAQLLANQLGDSHRDQELASFVDNIQQCVARIEHISGGLRRLVRDDTLESYQWISLNDVLETTVSLLQEIYANEGVTLLLNCCGYHHVMGHFGELQQVFLNLISNAKDAISTSKTKSINLALMGCGQRAIVTVTDTGVGIPEALQSVIFDPLYTNKLSGGGTGLGLGLCQRIVTEHGGDISVESKQGRGTCFTVNLPATHACPTQGCTTLMPDNKRIKAFATQCSASTLATDAQSVTIVVLDDEPMILDVIRAYLLGYGIKCLTTDSLDQALDTISTTPCSLLLTDLCMPGYSGTELLDVLYSNDIDVPVVVMTGGMQAKLADGHYSRLVKGLLYKPFDEDALIKEINRCLNLTLQSV